MKSNISFNIIIKQKQILLLIELVQAMMMVMMTAMITIIVLMRKKIQKRHIHKINQIR